MGAFAGRVWKQAGIPCQGTGANSGGRFAGVCRVPEGLPAAVCRGRRIFRNLQSYGIACGQAPVRIDVRGVMDGAEPGLPANLPGNLCGGMGGGTARGRYIPGNSAGGAEMQSLFTFVLKALYILRYFRREHGRRYGPPDKSGIWSPFSANLPCGAATSRNFSWLPDF